MKMFENDALFQKIIILPFALKYLVWKKSFYKLKKYLPLCKLVKKSLTQINSSHRLLRHFFSVFLIYIMFCFKIHIGKPLDKLISIDKSNLRDIKVIDQSIKPDTHTLAF